MNFSPSALLFRLSLKGLAMWFPKRFPDREISEPILVFNSISAFREVGIVSASLTNLICLINSALWKQTKKQLWTFANQFRYFKTNLI